jgi:hypothetical protein
VVDGLVRSGLVARDSFPPDLTARCFREDLHAQARALLSNTQTNVA